jgi:hypothetical protein
MGTVSDLEAEYGMDAIDICHEYEYEVGVPGICTNSGCTFTAEYEPDCTEGYCEECKTKTVKSIFVIFGII